MLPKPVSCLNEHSYFGRFAVDTMFSYIALTDDMLKNDVRSSD